MRNVLLVLILGAAGAFAATVQFTALPLNTAYGTYNGFGQATVDGMLGQFLVCDDYGHITYFPSGPLTYEVSTLAGTNPLQYARFADPLQWEDSLARYEQAALLADGLLHTSPMLNLAADYQYALWRLFTPTVTLPNNSTAQTLLNDTAFTVASTIPGNLDIYARLLIFTPTGQFASNQEFLAMAAEPMTWSNTGPPLFGPLTSPNQPVPEPAPWVLMSIGTGLLVLSSVLRRVRALVRTRSAKR